MQDVNIAALKVVLDCIWILLVHCHESAGFDLMVCMSVAFSWQFWLCSKSNMVSPDACYSWFGRLLSVIDISLLADQAEIMLKTRFQYFCPWSLGWLRTGAPFVGHDVIVIVIVKIDLPWSYKLPERLRVLLGVSCRIWKFLVVAATSSSKRASVNCSSCSGWWGRQQV